MGVTQLAGLCGYAGSGKDTAAANMPGWTRVSFADGVREVLLAIDPLIDGWNGWRVSDLVVGDEFPAIGWQEAKIQYPELRRLLQKTGTEAGRNIIGENVWVDIAKRKVEALDCNVVITDCRFPNEIAFIREKGGAIIRILRPGIGPVNGHSSETAIDHIQPDAEVVNDGTPEELGKKILGAIADLNSVMAL